MNVMTFAKSLESERRAVIALLNQSERSIQQAFSLFVNKTTDELAMKAVRVALQKADIDAATQIAVQHTLVLRNAIDGAINRAATREAKLLAGLVKDAPNIAEGIRNAASKLNDSGIVLDFTRGDSAAARIAQRSAANSVREFSRRQRLSTREAIREGLAQGEGQVAMAARFKDSIGLTRAQMKAVNNYRRLLEGGSREAANRALRDQRYDSPILRDRQHTPEEIDRMVAAYQRNAIKARAEVIARTEALRAVGVARSAAQAKIVDELEIENRIVRIWNSHHDHRVRDTHREMDQQERGENEAFVSPSGAKLMFPGDPSAPLAEVINCRCVLTTRID